MSVVVAAAVANGVVPGTVRLAWLPRTTAERLGMLPLKLSFKERTRTRLSRD